MEGGSASVLIWLQASANTTDFSVFIKGDFAPQSKVSDNHRSVWLYRYGKGEDDEYTDYMSKSIKIYFQSILLSLYFLEENKHIFMIFIYH